MSLTAVLAIVGLLLNAAGVLLLFYFGMPYRTRTEGKTARTVITPEHDELLRRDRIYDWLSGIGLVCILVGTALQISAAYST